MLRKVLWLIALPIVAVTLIGGGVYAQTKLTDIEVLLKILSQLESLQTQLKAIEPPTTPLVFTNPSRGSLKRGSRGKEVKQLQTFLKQFPNIYPEGLVTGFLGPATERAINRFKAEYGLKEDGVVDDAVIEKLNEFVAGASPISAAAPVIPATQVIPPAIPAAQAQPAAPNQPVTPATPAVPAAVSSGGGGGSNGQPNPPKPGLPFGTILPGGDPNDQTPPVISDIRAGNADDYKVTITWKTNEPATSWVLSNRIPSDFMSGVLNSDYVTSHSMTIHHFVNWSDYYFRVQSWDVNGNLATSEPINYNPPSRRPFPPVSKADYAIEWPDRDTACIKAGGSPGGTSGCVYKCPDGLSYSDTDPRTTGSIGFWYGCAPPGLPLPAYPIHPNTCYNIDGVAFMCPWFVPKVIGTRVSPNYYPQIASVLENLAEILFKLLKIR